MNGIITALTTPMFGDGTINVAKLRSTIDFQISSGVSAIVVAGTTGEVSTLSFDEHLKVIGLAKRYSRGRVPIIAGAGSNSTGEAIELAKQSKRLGADATLQVVPYYNKPTQSGLYSHFKRIAESVDIDIILYNVPNRTGTSLLIETVQKLSEVPNIIGLKESSSHLIRNFRTITMIKKKRRFIILSGDDLTFEGLVLMGGDGVISVLSNLLPHKMVELYNTIVRTKSAPARTRHSLYFDICQSIFKETNPVPIKWIQAFVGLLSLGTRLPLTIFSSQHHFNCVRSYLDFKEQ